MERIFFGFASGLNEVSHAVAHAAKVCRVYPNHIEIVPWTNLDVAGRFIKQEVLGQIDRADFLFADISTLNMNVAYEVGYGIGAHKPVRLVVNSVYKTTLMRDTQRVGIFDTIGFKEYENGDALADYIIGMKGNKSSLPVHEELDRRAPVYVVDAPHKTDLVVSITHHARKNFVTEDI